MKQQRAPKRSVLPQVPPTRRAIHPTFRIRPLLARDDASGSDRRPDEPLKLLIVEDDYLVATQMEQALTEAGFAVAGVAASAEEAIEQAMTKRVSLVIMDIRLASRRDGIDAAIELFERQGIRSIFATAHGDADSRKRAESASPLGWLQKPYSMASLIEAVRKSLVILGKSH